MKGTTNGSLGKATLRVGVMGLLTLFIAGPAPGNIGGCGSTAANMQIVAGENGIPTAEYVYFDRSVCTYFCQKAFECGQLCNVLAESERSDIDGVCVNASPHPRFFEKCVHGALDPAVTGGRNTCPHDCRQYGSNFRVAYEWDVQSCGEAILATTTCDLPSIGGLFAALPGQCLNSVCPLQ